jgi:hypothetical protein
VLGSNGAENRFKRCGNSKNLVRKRSVSCTDQREHGNWQASVGSAAVAITFDKESLSVVQKTVQQGGGYGGVTGEDAGPVLEGDP